MKPQRILALVHKGLEPPDEKVDKATALQEFTVLLTVQVMNYLHSGRHRIAL